MDCPHAEILASGPVVPEPPSLVPAVPEAPGAAPALLVPPVPRIIVKPPVPALPGGGFWSAAEILEPSGVLAHPSIRKPIKVPSTKGGPRRIHESAEDRSGRAMNV